MESFDYEPVSDRAIQDAMLREVDRDTSTSRPKGPARLTERGRELWRVMLYEAVRAGTSAHLAAALKRPGMLDEREPSKTSKTGSKRVPSNAAEQMAQGAFNHLYCRAVCSLCASRGQLVEVYRASSSGHSRKSSNMLVGQHMPGQILHAYLTSPEQDPNIAFGPNSGLSVRPWTAKTG